jgi:hypothetical protein
MDPDLVRQQAEEEAASRLLPRRELPPQMRREPVLPMGASLTASVSGPLRAEPPAAPAAAPAPLVTAGWRTAIGVATTCMIGTTVGLVGGMMLGVKLQLVPWQVAAVGTSTALLLGWQLSALALRRRGRMVWWRAYRVGFRTAFLVLFVMAGAMFVAPHYLGAGGTGPSAPFPISTFWKSVAAGAVVSILLGAMMLRRAFRIAATKR